MQTYINYAADVYTVVPKVNVNGRFDMQTQNAVRIFQEVYGIPVSGTVGPLTWYELASIYEGVENGISRP